MNTIETLNTAFTEFLELPADATAWLLDLWRLIQVFDDIADGDKVDRADLDNAVWASMSGMPSNPFFINHSGWLIPAQTTAVLKWMASNRAESNGRADVRSYNWRAGYYDVVCLVVALVHGPNSEKSEIALGLYGERLADYLGEFNA